MFRAIKGSGFGPLISMFLAGGILPLALTQSSGAVVLKSEIVVSSGLNHPIFAAAPANEFGHLYISEAGIARLQRLDLVTKQLTTVLDLPDVVVGNQSGLNGFAFHPDFANNGKLYVNLSGSDPAGDVRILEFTRSAVNPDVFDPSTRRELLKIDNPKLDHWGGWIGFGPSDGLLYVATGDGGNVPPQETKGLDSQNLNDLKGKILRLDVDGDDFPDDESRNYSIPATNPFAQGGGSPEIFALGLRHPFRSGFDRATGDLYIGDVGSRFWEEINVLPAGTNGGQNFGWRPLEGHFDNPDWADPAPLDPVYSIYEYPHGSAAAVIGGVVYRGDAIPSLQGTYIFGDFVQQSFTSLHYEDEVVSELTDRGAELAQSLGAIGGIANFAEDAAGEIYLIDFLLGRVHKIVAAPPTEQGDYNLDGIVDAADYTVWRDAFGQAVPMRTGADGNGSGMIDAGDYDVWKSNFGDLVAQVGAAAGQVSVGLPEPTSVWLLASGLAIFYCCRAYVR